MNWESLKTCKNCLHFKIYQQKTQIIPLIVITVLKETGIVLSVKEEGGIIIG